MLMMKIKAPMSQLKENIFIFVQWPLIYFALLEGLEAFGSHALVVSSVEKLVVGKILLMETLEPCQDNETPVAVLYDTSQDDDINMNSACRKALQDDTMKNLLTVRGVLQTTRIV